MCIVILVHALYLSWFLWLTVLAEVFFELSPDVFTDWLVLDLCTHNKKVLIKGFVDGCPRTLYMYFFKFLT